MDEPFAEIDAQTRVDLEDLIRRLWRRMGGRDDGSRDIASPAPQYTIATLSSSATSACRHDAALNILMMQSERLADRKNDRSSRYASNFRPHSTWLARSVRDCAIDLNFAVSSSPSANSIADPALP
jgi:hypothetical protein